MVKKYEFESFKFKDMEFSKDGQLDELIALDRYAVTTYDNYKENDTVVAIIDKDMGTKRVGVITKVNGDGTYEIVDRFGDSHTVEEKLMQKPLETRPQQFWVRWAKGGASVEKTKELQKWFENELRWLFDGYRYSLGGRIQLMLGQEFVTGKKANLTAYNCFVIRSPHTSDDPKEQFLDVVDVAYYEASIMRRGGGVGLNISTINTVKGSGKKLTDFIFYLDESHPDYQELKDRMKLGKFKGVTVVTNKEDFDTLIKKKNAHVITAIDSVDGLFENAKEMVSASYDGEAVAINFTPLRERNAIVKGVNGRSSGAVSWAELFVLLANLLQQDTIDAVDFAEIFSHIVHLIIQGGSRRGALMLICNVDNPNIYKFMERKKQMGYLSGANISVGIDDDFMSLILRGRDGETSEEIEKALKIWNVLIESAWASAEPGIVWLERYNKESNSYYFHDIVATNPCG